MGTFDPYPTPEKGTSFEQLQLYTEVLLAAAELAGTLENLPAVGEQHTYRIVDPRVIDNVEIPEEIRLLLPSDTSLESIVCSVWGNRIPDTSTQHVSTHLSLELSDGIAAGIESLPEHDMTEFMVRITNEDTSSYSQTLLPAEEVSSIIARMTHPTNDPAFSDFKNPNDPSKMREICETLENSIAIEASHELIYEIDNTYQVHIQKNGDKIRAVEVTEIRYDKPSITFVIEYTSMSTAGTLYRASREGSEELTVEEGDLERFVQIIIALKRSLELNEVAMPPSDEF